jgi:SOS-response transcriptional repressor LexA
VDNEEVRLDEVVYHAGFPNAAEDSSSLGLSLDRLVVRRPVSTYFWHLAEDITPIPGWLAGDVVVVDRSLQPSVNDWVVAIVDDDFVLCRYRSKTNLLRASGEKVESAAIWGVVTYVVQKASNR